MLDRLILRLSKTLKFCDDQIFEVQISRDQKIYFGEKWRSIDPKNQQIGHSGPFLVTSIGEAGPIVEDPSIPKEGVGPVKQKDDQESDSESQPELFPSKA